MYLFLNLNEKVILIILHSLVHLFVDLGITWQACSAKRCATMGSEECCEYLRSCLSINQTIHKPQSLGTM